MNTERRNLGKDNNDNNNVSIIIGAEETLQSESIWSLVGDDGIAVVRGIWRECCSKGHMERML